MTATGDQTRSCSIVTPTPAELTTTQQTLRNLPLLAKVWCSCTLAVKSVVSRQMHCYCSAENKKFELPFCTSAYTVLYAINFWQDQLSCLTGGVSLISIMFANLLAGASCRWRCRWPGQDVCCTARTSENPIPGTRYCADFTSNLISDAGDTG